MNPQAASRKAQSRQGNRAFQFRKSTLFWNTSYAAPPTRERDRSQNDRVMRAVPARNQFEDWAKSELLSRPRNGKGDCKQDIAGQPDGEHDTLPSCPAQAINRRLRLEFPAQHSLGLL
ncbi:MAG: hypothetical protein KGO48_03445 [Alphaproteobacteria bacterium]|nr:hypothetical protein [Alphaproteobacteria bacterium]